MAMEEYEKIILKLLSYVVFIREENIKIQCFLSSLQAFYKDLIMCDEPRTLKEFTHKDKWLYEQGMNIHDLHKD